MDKGVSIISGLMFLIFIIIFTFFWYPIVELVIFFDALFIVGVVIIVLKHQDVPLRVGLFTCGAVFDYHGKYEYLYWYDVVDIKDAASPKLHSYKFIKIIKKNGLNKSLGFLDTNINLLIKTKIMENSDVAEPSRLPAPSR